MSILQYAFCGLYAIVGLALIILIAMQQGQERNALGALSGGGAGETYYAKNMAQSAEAKKKRWTVILGVVFVALNGGCMFLF